MGTTAIPNCYDTKSYLVFYYHHRWLLLTIFFSWIVYYSGIVNSVVILGFTIPPCLAFLFFAIDRSNARHRTYSLLQSYLWLQAISPAQEKYDGYDSLSFVCYGAEPIRTPHRKDSMNAAYKKVCANQGAGGVDEVTVEGLGDYIKEN